jgi:hypothetical protein
VAEPVYGSKCLQISKNWPCRLRLALAPLLLILILILILIFILILILILILNILPVFFLVQPHALSFTEVDAPNKFGLFCNGRSQSR